MVFSILVERPNLLTAVLAPALDVGDMSFPACPGDVFGEIDVLPSGEDRVRRPCPPYSVHAVLIARVGLAFVSHSSMAAAAS
jgi:hypothetical protein